MKVHAIVEDLETARRAIVAGATVVQLRVKGSTDEVIAAGRGFRALGTTFVEVGTALQEQSWEDLEYRHVNGVEVLRELARSRGGTAGGVMPVVFTSTLVQQTEGVGTATVHAAHILAADVECSILSLPRLLGLHDDAGPNFTARVADIQVSRGGHAVATFHPSRRMFTVQKTMVTDTAIETNGFRDLYAVLGEERDGAAVLRLHVNPLAPWIWLGALIMAMGGVLSLADRRLRIGAPARRSMPAQADLVS